MKMIKRVLLCSALALGLSACDLGEDDTPPTEYHKVQIKGTGSNLAIVTYTSQDNVGMWQDPFDDFTEIHSTDTFSATVDFYKSNMDLGDIYLYTIDIERQEDYAIINGETYNVTYTDKNGTIVTYNPE